MPELTVEEVARRILTMMSNGGQAQGWTGEIRRSGSCLEIQVQGQPFTVVIMEGHIVHDEMMRAMQK